MVTSKQVAPAHASTPRGSRQIFRLLNDLKRKNLTSRYLAFVFSMTPIFYVTCLFVPIVEHVRSPGVKLLLRVVPPAPSKMILLLAWAQSHHKTISSSEEETY